MTDNFEQGPIRPPSEAQSLLVRVTRNCPWNKCAFCVSYRRERFSLRSVAEIKGDIDIMGRIAREIEETSRHLGAGGKVTAEVVSHIYNQETLGDAYRSVAAWLYFGGRSVFLQDADSLIVKTSELLEIIEYIKEVFPGVERLTSYCRSHTAARKGVDALTRLRAAGLSRIHIGMESGHDPVLDFISKGASAEEHIRGGQNIVAAGISLCEYVIPGLGGKKWSTEHAVATARVINAINPDFVRLRSLHIMPGTPLEEAMKSGMLEPLTDEEVVAEIRLFIENLEGVETTVVSDHVLNLLEEVEGTLPRDREKMLGVLDRFLSLAHRERLIFQLGRRRGIYRRLDDLHDLRTREMLGEVVDRVLEENPHDFDAGIRRIKNGFV